MIVYIPHTFQSVPAYYVRIMTMEQERFIDAYSNIGSRSSSQPFSQAYTKGELKNAPSLALSNVGIHCHTYLKCTGSLQNMGASIIRTLSGSPWCPQ